jgi:hypothetical protein
LPDQERAERRVAKRLQSHARVRFDNPFAENAGDAAVDVMNDKPRCPEVLRDVREQPIDSGRFAPITGVSMYPMRLLERLEHRLTGVPGRHGNTHAILCEQSRAT